MEGNLNEIHGLFEENPLRIEIDISLDPYGSVWLKLITIIVYVVEVIASMVMMAFVAFETQGLAGHYRTLINQLLSYLYGGVSIQICHCLNLSYLLHIFLILLYTAMPNRNGTFCNDCKITLLLSQDFPVDLTPPLWRDLEKILTRKL